MKKLFLLSLIILSNNSDAQKPSKDLLIDSVFIYKGFFSGGTTAVLRYNSNMLDTSMSPQIKLSTSNLDTLKLFMRPNTSTKHFQQKVGPSYYAVLYSNKQKHKLAIVPRFGIIDLSTKRQYVLKNTEYENIYERFVENNCR